MKLHLGVVDLPYQQAPAPIKPGKKTPKYDPAGTTTFQVATWLENYYHPMEVFYEDNILVIAEWFAEGLKDTLNNIMLGAPLTADPFAEACGKIEDGFKQYVALRRYDSIGMPGVPTRASLEGVNHRLKVKRGPPRPSFIDTGLYVSSFKSWVEQ